jgi:hypothetical protein
LGIWYLGYGGGDLAKCPMPKSFHPHHLRALPFKHSDVAVANGNINPVPITFRPNFVCTRLYYFLPTTFIEQAAAGN